MPEAETETRTSATVVQELLGLGEAVREQRERPREERSENWQSELRDNIASLHAADAELTAILAAEDVERRTRGLRREGPTAATGETGQDTRSAGQVVADDAEFRQWMASTGGKGTSPSVEVRTLITTSTSDDPAAGTWLPTGQPMQPTARRRRLFIRDLLATGTTGLNSVPYIRELNPTTTEVGASATSEGSAKAEVTLSFVGDDAPARKITAWVPVTTEILEDAPTLRSYIDARLGYMLAVREEEQLLNGNGTTPNLKGIRQFTGLQTQAAVSGDNAATLGRAIGKVETVDGVADGIAMNPTDFWVMLTTRFANQFDGGFASMLPFGGTPGVIWGVPVVRTRSIESGKALVGSFRLGAQIFDRKAITIRAGDQHDDFFTSNKVAILAEERLALAVYRPDFFVEASL